MALAGHGSNGVDGLRCTAWATYGGGCATHVELPAEEAMLQLQGTTAVAEHAAASIGSVAWEERDGKAKMWRHVGARAKYLS